MHRRRPETGARRVGQGVPVQMWKRRAQSWCRCGQGVSPVQAQPGEVGMSPAPAHDAGGGEPHLEHRPRMAHDEPAKHLPQRRVRRREPHVRQHLAAPIYAAACCTALQRVALRCSVLRCVAACCTALQRVARRCSVLHCVAACFSVLHCVAACWAAVRRLCGRGLSQLCLVRRVAEPQRCDVARDDERVVRAVHVRDGRVQRVRQRVGEELDETGREALDGCG
jgi:hypothetical protein